VALDVIKIKYIRSVYSVPLERSSMVERSVRSACDRGSQAPVSMASHRMGDQNILSRAPPCFGRHVKLLVPAAFAVVSSHSSFKGG
jgi:hypothetical protein